MSCVRKEALGAAGWGVAAGGAAVGGRRVGWWGWVGGVRARVEQSRAARARARTPRAAPGRDE